MTVRYRVTKTKQHDNPWCATRVESGTPTAWTYFTSWRAALAFTTARTREYTRIQSDINTLNAYEEHP